MKQMTRMEQIVHEAIVNEGIAKPAWRFTVDINERGYQFIEIAVQIFKPRARKASQIWYAPYDTFRNLLHWGDAKQIYDSEW